MVELLLGAGADVNTQKEVSTVIFYALNKTGWPVPFPEKGTGELLTVDLFWWNVNEYDDIIVWFAHKVLLISSGL